MSEKNLNQNTEEKKKRKLNKEATDLIREEVAKNMSILQDSLLENMKILFDEHVEEKKKQAKKNKEIEETIALFLEHYTSLKEYVEEAKKKELNEEFLEETKNSLLSSLMESRIDSHEAVNKFSVVFKNIEKTEILLNFLTNTFNHYIEDNIHFDKKIIVLGTSNNTNKRRYRTAALLKRYYMEGKELDDIGLYNEDVYYTGSSEYQKKFMIDRRILIKNLAPMIFGIDGIELLRRDS